MRCRFTRYLIAFLVAFHLAILRGSWSLAINSIGPCIHARARAHTNYFSVRISALCIDDITQRSPRTLYTWRICDAGSCCLNLMFNRPYGWTPEPSILMPRLIGTRPRCIWMEIETATRADLYYYFRLDLIPHYAWKS